jgi:hypothetical protein
MGILEDINNMKNQGMQENEITRKLQEKGASPKAIEDAFNQIRIKNAISAEYPGEDGMEPSIMKNTLPASPTPPLPPPSPLYFPKTQEIEHDSREFYSPQPSPPPQTPPVNEEPQAPMYGEYNQRQYLSQEEQYAPQGEQYTPQEENYSESQTGGLYDTENIIEIAEQVFSEKIKKEQKQIDSLNEFATLAETRIADDHERIKRIETIIDNLQISILEKIGSYGKNLESIKNEMGMMQESFEKMIPSLHEKGEDKKPQNPKNKSQIIKKS